MFKCRLNAQGVLYNCGEHFITIEQLKTTLITKMHGIYMVQHSQLYIQKEGYIKDNIYKG